MKIKLVQSGGFLPVTKEAETDVDWTKEESEDLLKHVEVKDAGSSPVRDGIYHTLEINNKEVAVDPEKAPQKYAHVFSRLKKELKIVKR